MGNLVDYRSVKKHVHDGFVFDSKKEVVRYDELKLLQVLKQISGLSVHPEFTLQPSFKRGNKTYRKITYVADFSYYEKGNVIVEDVKGFETAVWKLKEKMFRYVLPTFDLRIIGKPVKLRNKRWK